MLLLIPSFFECAVACVPRMGNRVDPKVWTAWVENLALGPQRFEDTHHCKSNRQGLLSIAASRAGSWPFGPYELQFAWNLK